MKKMALTLLMIVNLQSCNQINTRFGLADDNIIEEIVEAIIHQETGIDVDLTPSTPEDE